MKTFNQLTPELRQKAVRYAQHNLMFYAAHGFRLYEEEHNKAKEECDRLRTPWFFHTALMENLLKNEGFVAEALEDAKSVVYVDSNCVRVSELDDLQV